MNKKEVKRTIIALIIVIIALIIVNICIFFIGKHIQNNEQSTESAKVTSADDTDSNSSETEDSENIVSTIDNLVYTIDITNIDSDNIAVGNTATLNGYCGRIEINEKDNKLEVGKTYVVEALPLIETADNGLPLINAVSVKEASNDDIVELESVRGEVSNYNKKMAEYKSMSVDDIINDANSSYATWTQSEITKFIEYLDKLKKSSSTKCYVCTRENIVSTYSE